MRYNCNHHKNKNLIGGGALVDILTLIDGFANGLMELQEKFMEVRHNQFLSNGQ